MVVVHAVVVVVVVVVSARTRRVGKFDGDRFARAVRNETIELLDRAFRLVTLIKPYEADAFRQT